MAGNLWAWLTQATCDGSWFWDAFIKQNVILTQYPWTSSSTPVCSFLLQIAAAKPESCAWFVYMRRSCFPLALDIVRWGELISAKNLRVEDISLIDKSGDEFEQNEPYKKKINANILRTQPKITEDNHSNVEKRSLIKKTLSYVVEEGCSCVAVISRDCRQCIDISRWRGAKTTIKEKKEVSSSD